MMAVGATAVNTVNMGLTYATYTGLDFHISWFSRIGSHLQMFSPVKIQTITALLRSLHAAL